MLYEWTVSLRDKASASMDKVSSGATKLNARMQRLTKSFGSVDKSANAFKGRLFNMDNAFAGWGNSLISNLKQFGIEAAQVGIGFEATMSRVEAVSGTSGQALANLEGLAKRMGSETKFSATQAAEAMQFMAMAGMDANKIMESLPSTLSLAASTGIDLGRAADIATNALSAYGLEASQLGSVVDVIAKTTTTANTNTEQFAEAFKYAAPLAKSAGIEITELSAAIGILGNSGIQGSLAGTGLQTAISRLLKPSNEARRVLRKLQVDILGTDGRMRSLSDIMSQLEKASASSADMLTIFGIEAGSKMQVLLDSGSNALSRYTKQLEDSQGTAKGLADTMQNNLQGRIDSMRAKFETLAITLFEKLEPAMTAVVDGLGRFAVWAEKNASLVVALSAGVAVAASVWGSYAAYAALASIASGGLTASVVALGPALWASGIAPIALLVGGLAAAFTYAYQESEDFRNIIDAVGGAIAEVWEGMKQLWELLTDSQEWAKVGEGFKELGKMFGLVSEEAEKTEKAVKKVAKQNVPLNSNLFPFAKPQGMLEKQILSGGSGNPPALSSSGLPTKPNKPNSDTQVDAGFSQIAGGGPQQKNFNITIQKFQDQTVINTQRLEEGVQQTQEAFEEMFLRVLNGIQARQ